MIVNIDKKNWVMFLNQVYNESNHCELPGIAPQTIAVF